MTASVHRPTGGGGAGSAPSSATVGRRIAPVQTVADCHGLSQTVADCHRVSQSVADCHGLSQTVKTVKTVADCHRLSQTVTDRCKLSQTVTIFHGLSQTVADCHGLSQTVTDCRGAVAASLRGCRRALDVVVIRHCFGLSTSSSSSRVTTFGLKTAAGAWPSSTSSSLLAVGACGARLVQDK